MIAWGKVPVRCADTPGFIVNRVNRPFTLEALAMLDGGRRARVETIDEAIRADGYPMGPFELMDLVGIDINLAAATGIFERVRAAGDPLAERFRPSPIQERLVAAGRLGRKTGAGFYRYDDERAAGPALPPAFADRPPDRDDATRVGAAIRVAADHAGDRQRGVPGARRGRRDARPTSTWRCAWAPATRAGRSNGR